ncbi:MAG: cytochrome oxidase small assembly protein [Sulfuritalea sp.]|nr:cytochrome oxidase small assembly protein [Sulfuritalea sp.]
MPDRLAMEHSKLTPRQRQGNRRIALVLALFAFLVFASFIARQWLASS